MDPKDIARMIADSIVASPKSKEFCHTATMYKQNAKSLRVNKTQERLRAKLAERNAQK